MSPQEGEGAGGQSSRRVLYLPLFPLSPSTRTTGSPGAPWPPRLPGRIALSTVKATEQFLCPRKKNPRGTLGPPPPAHRRLCLRARASAGLGAAWSSCASLFGATPPNPFGQAWSLFPVRFQMRAFLSLFSFFFKFQRGSPPFPLTQPLPPPPHLEPFTLQKRRPPLCGNFKKNKLLGELR